MSISLDGLVSGMGTQEIIDQLVQLERQPIYRYENEISELEQTKNAWRDINTRLDKLENLTTDLKLSATFNSRTASSSNEDAAAASAANNAVEANYSLTVQSTAKIQRIAGEKMIDSDTALRDMDGFDNLSEENIITINETEISINDTDTLNDISDKINEADAGVRASIVDNHLVIETMETGVENALNPEPENGDPAAITDDNGLLQSLGVLNSEGNIANELQQASDAEIDINGISGITSSSNTFFDVVDGVTFDINPDAEEGSFTHISISKDTAKAVDAVQAFVNQYNSVMNFIDGKTEYDVDDGRGEILQGDSTASRLQMRLRELVTSMVKDEGDYKTLGSIGIEIDRDGVMSFETSKFEEVLQESPEEVMNLFRADSESEGYDGMAVRLDNYLDQLMQVNTGLIPRRLDFFDTRIDSLNDDIENVERRVEMTRTRYIKQFTAMEEAISQMQQQQSWMMSQLQSLGGSSNMMGGMM